MVVKRCLATVLSVIISFSVYAQSKEKGAKEAIYAFKDAVNDHDIVRIAALLTSDYLFIDAADNEVKGAEQATTRWKELFRVQPYYHIGFTDVFGHGDTLAAFGFIENKGKVIKGNWRTPVSWKVVVRGRQIKLWQVYGEMTLPKEVTTRIDNVDSISGVTGVGGLFFKSKDAKSLKSWYKQHLHIDAGPYGAKFEWRDGADASLYGCTQWNAFSEKTTYFAPSTKDFMINYRVRNIELLVEQLRKDSVIVLDAIESSDFGKFVHILDCDSNKVELWEPKAEGYDGKAKQ